MEVISIEQGQRHHFHLDRHDHSAPKFPMDKLIDILTPPLEAPVKAVKNAFKNPYVRNGALLLSAASLMTPALYYFLTRKTMAENVASALATINDDKLEKTVRTEAAEKLRNYLITSAAARLFIRTNSVPSTTTTSGLDVLLEIIQDYEPERPSSRRGSTAKSSVHADGPILQALDPFCLAILSCVQAACFDGRNCEVLGNALVKHIISYCFCLNAQVRCYSFAILVTLLVSSPTKQKIISDQDKLEIDWENDLRNPRAEILETIVDNSIPSLCLDLIASHAGDVFPEKLITSKISEYLTSSQLSKSIDKESSLFRYSQQILSYCLRLCSVFQYHFPETSFREEFFKHASFDVFCLILSSEGPTDPTLPDIRQYVTNSMLRDSLHLLSGLAISKSIFNSRVVTIGSSSAKSWSSFCSKQVCALLDHDDHSISFMASLALGNLSLHENPDLIRIIMNRHIVQKMITLCDSPSFSTPTLVRHCRTLYEISHPRDIALAVSEHHHIFIPTLLKIGSKVHHPAARGAIVASIGCLAGRTPTSRVIFRQLGGLKFLVDMLFSSNVSILAPACYTLTQMAVDDNNVLEIVRYGALDGALNIISRYQPDGSNRIVSKNTNAPSSFTAHLGLAGTRGKSDHEHDSILYAAMFLYNCCVGEYAAITCRRLYETNRLYLVVRLYAHPTEKIREQGHKIIKNVTRNVPEESNAINSLVNSILQSMAQKQQIHKDFLQDQFPKKPMMRS